MTCLICPGNCSNCNINIVSSNSSLMQSIICGGSDNACSKGIICTDCLQGYIIVGSVCVDLNSCRQYSYYMNITSSSIWNASNCYCLDGYYFSSNLTCRRCDISCLTCNGPTNSSCLACDEGYILSANICIQNQVIRQDLWLTIGAIVTNSPLITTNNGAYIYCGNYYTLFGFQTSYNTGSYLTYITPIFSAINYYAISFKMTVLFIDNWENTSSLYFRLNSFSANPSFIYNYDNKGANG